MTTQPVTNAWLPLILAGLSFLGMIYLSMTLNDRVSAQKVSALEAQQENTTQRLDRIELKLDKLLERWGLR